MEKQQEIKTRSTEILIIGGGAAGLSAAIYAARAGRKAIVLEGRASSRLKLGYSVENYPGFIAIDSAELLQKFRDHAEHFGAEIIGDEAITFSLASDPKYVTTRDMLFESKAVIVASGKPITSGRMIPGEEKMQGGFDSVNRKETFGKNVVEVPYTSSFNLEENQQLLIVGVNHQKGLGCYWSLGFNSMTNEKLHEINAKNCTDDNFLLFVSLQESQKERY